MCLFSDVMTSSLCKKKSITLYFALRGRCLHMSIAVILCGVALHKMDTTGIFCNPLHIVQLHSLWHIAAAIAAIMAYEHAISEFPYYMNLPYVKTFPTVTSP